ncbi:hypothetical protein BDK92_6659 [Micromonospora pisi]|uniref:Uncharacterized protein n=1 Tax=Micromonospora pisi TaxID=589240 RepID=A0A495JTB2_9ACTN|nr:hypothetical protein [Micromonospora pisi]RKR92223.1 hypothetical protein BDK92_6659 [Micromonospora pisi]
MDHEAASRAVWVADRTIARLCATSYVQQVFPGAVRLWGTDSEPIEPDELDAVWRVPGDDGERLLVVTALAGEYELPRRRLPYGTTVVGGTRDYLRYAVERLREHGQNDLAGAIEREMYADRLWYFELAAVVTVVNGESRVEDVRARQYDISDASLLRALLAAIRAGDRSAIEKLRQPFGENLLKALVDAYPSLDTWPQRAHLVRAVSGHHGPMVTPVMAAILDIPDDAGGSDDSDMAREVRAIALSVLEAGGSAERFMRYYEDDEAAAAAIARHRAG